MNGKIDFAPGSLKGEELELTNVKGQGDSKSVLDFSKDTKSLMNDLRVAINSGANPIKLTVVLDSVDNLYKSALNEFKQEKPVTLNAIAKENSQLIDKLKEIKPIFGNRLELDFLNVTKNEGVTNWRDLDRISGPTEKQLHTSLEAKLKNSWENGQVSVKELVALAGNHQNASIMTGTKIPKQETVEKSQPNPKPSEQLKSQTPSQLKTEKDKVLDIVKSFNSSNEVKVMKAKPGSHDGFMVGATENFVVQQLGKESKFFMVHERKDLPGVTVNPNEKVRVLRTEAGQSKVEKLGLQNSQNSSMQLKR